MLDMQPEPNILEPKLKSALVRSDPRNEKTCTLLTCRSTHLAGLLVLLLLLFRKSSNPAGFLTLQVFSSRTSSHPPDQMISTACTELLNKANV